MPSPSSFSAETRHSADRAVTDLVSLLVRVRSELGQGAVGAMMSAVCADAADGIHETRAILSRELRAGKLNVAGLQYLIESVSQLSGLADVADAYVRRVEYPDNL